MAPSITLGYWKIRGLAAPVRLLLGYLNVEFSDVLYEQGDAPTFSRDPWLSVKHTLGLDFANLPYLIDESTGVKLSQSQAILRFIARQYGRDTGVYSGSPAELAAVDQLMDVVIDARQAMTRWAYTGGDAAAFFGEAIPPHLAALDAYVQAHAHGKACIAGGDAITLADFVAYEVVHTLSVLSAETVGKDVVEAGYPALAAWLVRFQVRRRQPPGHTG